MSRLPGRLVRVGLYTVLLVIFKMERTVRA